MVAVWPARPLSQHATISRGLAGWRAVSRLTAAGDSKTFLCLKCIGWWAVPSCQELVELINRRRPMGTPILKHLDLPRLMVGDEGFQK